MDREDIMTFMEMLASDGFAEDVVEEAKAVAVAARWARQVSRGKVKVVAARVGAAKLLERD